MRFHLTLEHFVNMENMVSLITLTNHSNIKSTNSLSLWTPVSHYNWYMISMTKQTVINFVRHCRTQRRKEHSGKDSNILFSDESFSEKNKEEYTQKTFYEKLA